ncbi:MAG: type II secretion system major pseudopilin GspG [Phycisphaerae bacterium]
MKRKRNKTTLRRRAFTLLEVLMVVVIIGILAALVVPNFFGAQEGAKIDLTRALIESGVNGTLDMYRMHMGGYPDTDEGLAALVDPPDDEELAEKWRGPYVKDGSKIKDAWGHDLIYESPGQYNEDWYDLSSMGPDGQEGTDDDITNWEKT